MYVFFLGTPKKGERVQLRAIGGYHRDIPPSAIKNVKLLGSDAKVEWELTSESLYVTMPTVEMNELTTVFKLELE